MIGLQKANFGKRIVAAIFDGIFVSIIAIGLITLLTIAFKTDNYFNEVNDAYSKYGTQYGIDFQISAQEYAELTEEKKADWDTAYAALLADEEAIYAYNMWVNLTLISTSVGVLVAVLIVEFGAALVFGNGQTLGKKIFGIALMTKDGVRVNNVQVFARALLGKFAIELMIPIYIVMMLFLNSIGVISVVILAILLIAEIVCLISSRGNSLLHDAFIGTVAVDMASQKIFDSRESLLEYTKKLHAEKANKNIY